jgi:hypothetical protein
MWQFLQTYGLWIVFGIFFLLMMRMHRGGMGGMHGGHGGGNRMRMDHSSEEASYTQRVVPLDEDQRGTVVRDINPEGKVAATSGSSRRRHSSC